MDAASAAHQALASHTTPSDAEAALRALPRPSRGNSPYALLTLRRQQVKWGDPRPGAAAVVRYAFVTGPVDRPNGVNCTAIGPIDGVLRHSELSTIRFTAEIRRAMAAWEEAANIRFEPAAESASADLLIGMQRQPSGIAFADVILRERGPGNMATIGQAAVCFNPELAWEDGFDGDDTTPDVRYVASHELGHVLGLDHAWGPDKLMSFKYSETFRIPQQNDLAGAVFLYGTRGSAPTPDSAVIPVAHSADGATDAR